MSAPYPTYDDEIEAGYREEGEYHRDEPLDEFCRHCDEPFPPDQLTDRLCPECMSKSGLVRCDNCGRAFAETIAKVEYENDLKFHYCPFCVKEINRKGGSK